MPNALLLYAAVGLAIGVVVAFGLGLFLVVGALVAGAALGKCDSATE